jgi:hypothetical protein
MAIKESTFTKDDITKKLVISLKTYTDDGWYGTRSRYYYAGPDGNGFKNKKEAKAFKSKLRKCIKERIKCNSKTVIDGDFVVGILDDFCTYKYCGAGPSYSCPNVEIKNI